MTLGIFFSKNTKLYNNDIFIYLYKTSTIETQRSA